MNQFDPQAHTSTGRFAFIHALWHAPIVGQARDAFFAEMARHRIPAEAIDLFTEAARACLKTVQSLRLIAD